jgi:NADPH:quinone reductase-like Zn-dependent oxidoreductase
MDAVLEKSSVKPVINEVYPFDQAIAAYRRLAKGAFGKIVINVVE